MSGLKKLISNFCLLTFLLTGAACSEEYENKISTRVLQLDFLELDFPLAQNNDSRAAEEILLAQPRKINVVFDANLVGEGLAMACGEVFIPMQLLAQILGEDGILTPTDPVYINQTAFMPFWDAARVFELGAGLAGDIAFLSTSPATSIPVLTYHHILPEDESGVRQDGSATISTANFEAQMRYLYDNNFYTPTLDDLEQFLFEGRRLPQNSVMIHFDDGYYSNFVYAYPILRQYGLRAQIFLITHLIEDLGEYQPAMCHNSIVWTAAHTILGTEDVFETASHTHNMHRLVEGSDYAIIATETKENIIADTLRSHEFVTNPRAFAYPRGQFNDTVIEALEASGITMAFTTRAGYITSNSDPMRLDRFIIFRTTPMERFTDIVNGRWP